MTSFVDSVAKPLIHVDQINGGLDEPQLLPDFVGSAWYMLLLPGQVDQNTRMVLAAPTGDQPGPWQTVPEEDVVVGGGFRIIDTARAKLFIDAEIWEVEPGGLFDFDPDLWRDPFVRVQSVRLLRKRDDLLPMPWDQARAHLNRVVFSVIPGESGYHHHPGAVVETTVIDGPQHRKHQRDWQMLHDNAVFAACQESAFEALLQELNNQMWATVTMYNRDWMFRLIHQDSAAVLCSRLLSEGMSADRLSPSFRKTAEARWSAWRAGHVVVSSYMENDEVVIVALDHKTVASLNFAIHERNQLARNG